MRVQQRLGFFFALSVTLGWCLAISADKGSELSRQDFGFRGDGGTGGRRGGRRGGGGGGGPRTLSPGNPLDLQSVFQCACESEIGDSCSAGTQCCPSLKCAGGRCLPNCAPLGSTCTQGVDNCCVLEGHACLFVPNVGPRCGVCIPPTRPCQLNVQPGFANSCCFGFVCQAVSATEGVCTAPPPSTP